MDGIHSTTPEVRISKLAAFETQVRGDMRRLPQVPLPIAEAQLVLDLVRTRHRYVELVEAQRSDRRPAA